MAQIVLSPSDAGAEQVAGNVVLWLKLAVETVGACHRRRSCGFAPGPIRPTASSTELKTRPGPSAADQSDSAGLYSCHSLATMTCYMPKNQSGSRVSRTSPSPGPSPDARGSSLSPNAWTGQPDKDGRAAWTPSPLIPALCDRAGSPKWRTIGLNADQAQCRRWVVRVVSAMLAVSLLYPQEPTSQLDRAT
jgi:hypothetical protein